MEELIQKQKTHWETSYNEMCCWFIGWEDPRNMNLMRGKYHADIDQR